MEFRQLAEQEPRVETGNVRFGNDWTGCYIRGDNAMWYAACLKHLLDSEYVKYVASYNRIALQDLLEILENCNEAKDK